MPENQLSFSDILEHIDAIDAELQRMTDRLSKLQIDLVKKRSMLTDWWAMQQAEKDHQHHFGHFS